LKTKRWLNRFVYAHVCKLPTQNNMKMCYKNCYVTYTHTHIIRCEAINTTSIICCKTRKVTVISNN